MSERRAKIVATVGPASAEPRILRALLRAGVDVVRLNLSHGAPEIHRRTIAAVREAAGAIGKEVPILLDLMGPRFRLAELAGGPRMLRRGERVSLGPASAGVELPIDDPEFLRHLRRGERVLIDNGLVELEVESKRGRMVHAHVLFGGAVSTRKGINLPDTSIPFSISPKDRADLAMAVEERADFIAASYVAAASDLHALRQALRELGDEIPLIAKLERAAAVSRSDRHDRIAELVEAADAVMVARGDLGVEVELARVPVLQKEIVAAGRRAGKPVIVATQMLESMMERPRPTRAEASDVANAVFDGADALMLSGETAAGRFPVEAVRTMARIIGRAEAYRQAAAAEDSAASGERHLDVPTSGPERGAQASALAVADVVAAAAVHAARRLPGSRIVAFSQGGFTARRVARYRPTSPAIVYSTDSRVARRMQLLWGVRPLQVEPPSAGLAARTEELIAQIESDLLRRRLVAPGEALVLLMGAPMRDRPLTNMVRIHVVRPRPVRRPARRDAGRTG